MRRVKTARLAAIGKGRSRRSFTRKKRPIMQDSEATAEKLATDLRLVISDAEALLRATAGQAGETIAAARAKVQESLDSARIELGALGEEYAQQVRAVDG